MRTTTTSDTWVALIALIAGMAFFVSTETTVPDQSDRAGITSGAIGDFARDAARIHAGLGFRCSGVNHCSRRWMRVGGGEGLGRVWFVFLTELWSVCGHKSVENVSCRSFGIRDDVHRRRFKSNQ